ncbi:hypothetical protein JCM8097_005419 [Rhodosporidiobolus ruineniae]
MGDLRSRLETAAELGSDSLDAVGAATGASWRPMSASAMLGAVAGVGGSTRRGGQGGYGAGGVAGNASPVKQEAPMSMPSPTQRRSKEEIARKKEEAMARLKQKDDLRKEQDRQKRREELAKMSLSSFGFTIKPGISRYGSGTGGVKLEQEQPAEPSKPKEWKPDERCSDEQLQVLEQVKTGQNVFFTGSAGVGKSFLLAEVTRLLDHLHRPYQVTATTGIAALQVSGITIHSWAGIGLGKEPIPVLFDRIFSNKEKRKKWLETQVLIIDEVSMSSADMFTRLHVLGKLIRNNNKPFGGLQLIVCGDYFQLPPVPEKLSEEKCMRCGHNFLQKIPIHDSRLPYEERAKGVPQADIYRCTDLVKRNGEMVGGCGFEWRGRRFCFETEAWAECDFKVMELTKVFRQGDPEFVATLEKFRRGICDEACIAFLKRCGTELGKGGQIKIQPTNLYPLRKSVDEENRREFEKLKEASFKFAALDDSRGGYAKMQMKERLTNVPPAQTLLLKKGAQVLLLANLDVKGGLVNGSRGVIVDWVDQNEIPVADSDDEDGEGDGGERMPGFVSQGGKMRGGMFGGEEWRAKAAEEWAEKQEQVLYPVVYFATGKQLIIKPHSWCIDIDKDNTVARTQLPLQLAWALTIHKSQGQSLDAVGVRLTSTFEKGQAYVALSRCRKPGGMKIEGFKPGVVMAHPVVKVFYETIADKTPFFVTPVPPVNPLSFIPEFDPLINKLAKPFGRPPVPLPVGSAVLAPGQTAPPRPPPPAATQSLPLHHPPTHTTTAGPVHVSIGGDWRSLLSQAATAYLVETRRSDRAGSEGTDDDCVVDDSASFVSEAQRAILAAVSGSAMARSASLNGTAMDVDSVGGGSEYETADSASMTDGPPGAYPPSVEGAAQVSGTAPGKKQKKKRWRKRVGH